MRFLVFAGFLATFLPGLSQKKELDATVYNDWKRIGEIQLSNDGKFSAYTIKPHRGDGYLYIVNNETGRRDSVFRGVDPQFSASSSYLVFRITAGFDTLRKLELDKVKKDKWPKDQLGIWFLRNDSLAKIPNVKDYKLAAKSDWLAYTSNGNEYAKGYLSKKQIRAEAKSIRKNGPVKSDGKLLTVWHPEQKKPVKFRNVTSYEISKNGAYVTFLEQQKFSKDSVRLNVLTTNNGYVWKTGKREIEFAQLNFGDSESKLVGLYSSDTNEVKRWNAFYFDCVANKLTTFADTSMYFERDRVVTNSFKIRFSKDETKLFFGVWNAPEKVVKDTLLESEKVKMDLWSWTDDRIQPQQLTEQKQDEADFNLHVYHLADQRFVQLGRDSLEIRLPSKGNFNYVLASSDEAFRYRNWETPSLTNYYRIPLETGEMELLREKTLYQASLSPSGRYFVYFDEVSKQLYAKDLVVETETCLTCKAKKVNWYEDVNGMPMIAGPRGTLGWTDNENGVLIQSEFDIYHYDFGTDELRSVTAAIRPDLKNNLYNYTLGAWSSDSIYVSPENSYITGLNRETKSEAVFQPAGTFPNLAFTRMAESDHHYTGWKKARNADTKLFQRHSVTDYPDLFVLGTEPRRISETNPQQKAYNWATAELISWKTYEGLELQGLVYKPENFDPNKEYPLLVYFYELYSDELHNHYAPKPTASIIFPTEYASAGYLIFIPDIRYKAGYPARSAYDCIMSGTDAVLKKYPNIDPKRLGLQGQSWGGYQTAQLVTMTDRYKAAMAGAPVSNMFSAYGGIRWGSGYSRQFQYEHTQSRIGKTIWEAPQLYTENSPLFGLPKVKTPLLIMHNDGDGAVPWYQGIELYMGLRRLQKPVWLLNYNGDDHNLMKNANRIDLSIRMRQFFDYYLLEKPAPLWLKEGIPAVEKGKKFKLELSE